MRQMRWLILRSEKFCAYSLAVGSTAVALDANGLEQHASRMPNIAVSKMVADGQAGSERANWIGSEIERAGETLGWPVQADDDDQALGG